MEKLFKEKLIELVPDYKRTTFYVAVSGGKDSMALTHLLLKLKLQPILLHCNFNLRGEESNEDALFVKSFATSHHLTCLIESFNTNEIAKTQKQNIQITARKLRYEWFSKITQGENKVLLTAHHLNDKIETFHINILRGTGIKGLTAIPKKRDNIIRPLLDFSSAEINNFLLKHKIQYREDSSNKELKYRRNKIRKEVIPLLAEIAPDFVEKMQLLMEELNDIENYLVKQVESFKLKYKAIHHDHESYDIIHIFELEDFFLCRVMSEYGLQRIQINAFKKLLSAKNGAIFQTNSHTFLKDREQIQIQANKELKHLNLMIHDFDLTIQTPFGSLAFETVQKHESIQFEKNIAYLNKNLLKLPLILTNTFHNTKFTPFGMKGKKLISDYLIDRKKSVFEKNKQLVLKDKDGVVWLVNERIDDRFKVEKDTNQILRVTYSE